PFAGLAAWWDWIAAREGFVRALPCPGEARLYARDFYAAPAAGGEK
ncbi:MAG: hypothetical protein H5U20_10185, partial [Rhodobacteraceae bacterium]|nr:hypothetical protein [Paracoccaceae bacterium]